MCCPEGLLRLNGQYKEPRFIRIDHFFTLFINVTVTISTHSSPAIDVKRRASDVVGFIRREKRRNVRHVFRPANPTQRYRGQYVFAASSVRAIARISEHL
jgi:hypothetical protein